MSARSEETPGCGAKKSLNAGFDKVQYLPRQISNNISYQLFNIGLEVHKIHMIAFFMEI